MYNEIKMKRSHSAAVQQQERCTNTSQIAAQQRVQHDRPCADEFGARNTRRSCRWLTLVVRRSLIYLLDAHVAPHEATTCQLDSVEVSAMNRLQKLRYPRWVAFLLWPLTLLLGHAGLPAGLAELTPRIDDRRTRGGSGRASFGHAGGNRCTFSAPARGGVVGEAVRR
jgi:hypothetical protein